MKTTKNNWFNYPRIIIGIMTGTSVDAVDTALVRFNRNIGRTELDLIEYDEYPIPQKLKDKINLAISNLCNVREISELNYEISNIYSKSVDNILKISSLKSDKIDCIGIHGQTVWHDPNGNTNTYPNTLQLGSIPVLANLTQIPVAGDFRAADIAVGGKGAPLVPIFDLEFLRQEYPVVTLNIGGIANITYMPENGSINDIFGFDTGPGNCLIDEYMKLLFGKDYDNNGFTASSGDICYELLSKLLEFEYFKLKPPKSTGRELFNIKNVNPVIKSISKGISDASLIRTLTEFSAITIADSINTYASNSEKVIASGGGTSNTFLVHLIREKLNEKELVLSDVFGIPSDAKEAICFAYLAYKCFGAEKSPVSKITGAGRDAILGSVSQP